MIKLRPVQAGDAVALFPMVHNSPVTATLAWDGPQSLAELQDSLAKRERLTQEGLAHNFTILESESGQPVGSASLRPDEQNFRGDVGLWIGERYQGRGYGTQTIAALVAYGFLRLGMEKIEAGVFTGNLPSRRVFEKNDFRLEGTLRKAVLKRSLAVDEWVFGLTRADWEAGLRLCHISPAEGWQSAREAGEYRPTSLASEGFIHFSRPDQVLNVANAFYRGMMDLLLLWVHPAKLSSPLRWDLADGELFPHLYGALNLDAVLATRAFTPDADGVFRKLPPV